MSTFGTSRNRYWPLHLEQHPEQREGEVWVTNVLSPPTPPAQRMSYRRTFRELPYKGKRMGRAAYDCMGRIEPSLRPVFVKTPVVRTDQEE